MSRFYSSRLRFFIFLIFLTHSLACLSQDSSFTFSTSYKGDILYNAQGGLKQSIAGLGLLEAGFEFDTRNAHLWKGGTLGVRLLNKHGCLPSRDIVGDLMGFDNIEANNQTRLYELWYKQKYKNLSLTIGLQDLNKAFIYPENSAMFIHSSLAIMYDVSVNMPLSVYPVTALGFIANYDRDKKLNFQLAIFDGNPGTQDENPFNLDWTINKADGFFSIAELHYHYNKNDKTIGLYKIGAYYHSAEFPDLIDTNKFFRGNYGAYVILDHRLASFKGKELAAFFHTGFAPADYNYVDYFFGGGLVLKGLLNNPDNELGIALAYTRISDELYENNALYRESETAIELSWKLPVNSSIFVQPDLQYIIHPGVNYSSDNAIIGLIRAGFDF